MRRDFSLYSTMLVLMNIPYISEDSRAVKNTALQKACELINLLPLDSMSTTNLNSLKIMRKIHGLHHYQQTG